MTTAPRYLTAVECLAIIQSRLLASDRRRIEFEALSTGDQEICIADATADIDACLWDGADAVNGQQTRFPRVLTTLTGGLTPSASSIDESQYLDPDPSPPPDPAVPGIPAGVRLGCAIQAAYRAFLAAGLSQSAHVEEAANKGITSHSSGGASQTTDLSRANKPWSRLCVDAQRHLAKYRRSGGAVT